MGKVLRRFAILVVLPGLILLGERLHNTGVAWSDGKFADPGTGQGNCKTPTLREIARTAPYMHNVVIATLEDGIEYYDRGGNRNSGLDNELRPLRLSLAGKHALVAFLSSLSGTIPYNRESP